MTEINQIPTEITVEHEPQKIYEVVVTDTSNGKILYQHKGYGGMACTVEKIKSFGGGNIEGVHQVLGWGNPLIQFYAYERIKEFLQAHSDELVETFMYSGTVGGDKEAFKKVLTDIFKKL